MAAKKKKPVESERTSSPNRADAAFEKFRDLWSKNKDGPTPQLMRASDLTMNQTLRRPTGITSLDVMLRGGFPVGPSIIGGPDGVGKDYLLWKTAAFAQRVYKDRFRMAVYLTESGLDKGFMKDICGFHVSFSDQEIRLVEQARALIGMPALDAEEIDYLKRSVGELYVAYGVSAEDALDVLTDMVESGDCQLVAINSLGFFETNAKLEKESLSENPQQQSEAGVMTKFITRLMGVMNRPHFDEGLGEYVPNETTVLLLKQVRARKNAPRPIPGRPVQAKDGYEMGSKIWAVQHAAFVELQMDKGAKIWLGEGEKKTYGGKEVHVSVNKGKMGMHEGGKVVFPFLNGTGVDEMQDLVNAGTVNGVIRKEKSTLSFTSDEGELFSAGSGARFCQLLRDTPPLYGLIRKAIFQKQRIAYLTKTPGR